VWNGIRPIPGKPETYPQKHKLPRLPEEPQKETAKPQKETVKPQKETKKAQKNSSNSQKN
jgi:hypothetical protein